MERNTAAFIVRLFIVSTICTGFASAFYKYESSYAFMNIRSEKFLDKASKEFCINFQQWKERDLPATVDEAVAYRLSWWNETRNTDICKETAANFTSNEIVPADYITTSEELARRGCNTRPGFNETQPVRPVRNEVQIMREQNVSNVLFLVDKNKRSYLFTTFYNGQLLDLDEALNVFYVYLDTFWSEIAPLLNSSDHQIRIYQPQSSLPMDPAVIVLWLFAFFSILIGSLWAAADTRTKLANKRAEAVTSSQTDLTLEEEGGRKNGTDVEQQMTANPSPGNSQKKKSTMKRSESTEIAQMNTAQHCCSVAVALVIVVVVLMLAFFFRDYALYFFHFFLVFFGSISLHSCLYSLLRWPFGGKDLELGNLRQLFSKFRPKHRSTSANSNANGIVAPEAGHGDAGAGTVVNFVESNSNLATTQPKQSTSTLDSPIGLLSLIVFLFSLGICLGWFLIRNRPYAYLLLDPINIAICIYAIRASRIHSLRLITFLLLAMFGYDLFMVFGTRLLTQDGCSVMMQVVTGMDCRPTAAKSTGDSQPLAPIDAHFPEKLPLLFYVPMLADPMAKCFDIQVEREYKHVMLGLGDVILPGYLVAFCFYVDAVRQNRRHTYGLISMIGYTVGMVSTFVALMLMETGQPALIYLVPCTLIPVFSWALFGDSKKGTLGKMWRGQI